MLEVDPARRPTAEQILNDEVFNFIRDGRQKTETELDTAGALDEGFIDMALNDALPYIEDEDKHLLYIMSKLQLLIIKYDISWQKWKASL